MSSQSCSPSAGILSSLSSELKGASPAQSRTSGRTSATDQGSLAVQVAPLRYPPTHRDVRWGFPTQAFRPRTCTREFHFKNQASHPQSNKQTLSWVICMPQAILLGPLIGTNIDVLPSRGQSSEYKSEGIQR